MFPVYDPAEHGGACMKGVLTKSQIMECPDEVLTCQNVSGVLSSNPNTIHLMATDRPELLGFPAIVMGSRVKIPRIPFMRYMGWI